MKPKLKEFAVMDGAPRWRVRLHRRGRRLVRLLELNAPDILILNEAIEINAISSLRQLELISG
jgi:hypothetical protein